MYSRMSILHYMGSGNWPVYIQRFMATVAMGLGQFQKFLSCDRGVGLCTTCKQHPVSRKSLFRLYARSVSLLFHCFCY